MLKCFCSDAVKSKYSSKNKYYDYVSKRLKKQQIALLELIYEDLASRNTQHLLTYDNFLVFFDLKGLWGAKLFKQFDEDGQHLVTFEEFLYGISRTAKAPMEEKIKLLYSFFEQNIEEGIDFKNFTKMLYNYSKEELKEILVSDGLVDQSVLKIHSQPIKTEVVKNLSDHNIIEINCLETDQSETSFDRAYQSLIKCHDEGTFYQINKDHLTYKVRYSNMSTLIKQFASEIYAKFGLNIKKSKQGRLQYEQFSEWIQIHKKLFRSYYSAFRTQLWSYFEDEPKYLQNKADLEFNGKISYESMKKKVYGLLIEDMLMFFENKKNRKYPFKVICMQGLNIKLINSMDIEISHSSSFYKTTVLHFPDQNEAKRWVEQLSMYERDCLNRNYIIGDVIGTGKFSIVYKCMEKLTQKQFALKVIDTEKLTEQANKLIKNQSQIMKILNHPQLIKYKQTIHSKTHEYIITEYVYGQDLFEYVKQRKSLNEFESAFIIGNIIKAVIFLHGIDILHRDLKPENIMVLFKNIKKNQIFQCTSPNIRKGQRIQDIKIIDFGLSNHISEIQKSTQQQAVGTPNYIAPEVLLGEQPTFKSDNFSIGAILYFLLSGTLPFYCNTLEATLIKTVRGQYDIKSQFWGNISEQAKDLISKLLEIEPEDRISLHDAVDHPWFKRAYTKTKSQVSKNDDPLLELHPTCNQVNINERRSSDKKQSHEQEEESNHRHSC